MVSISLETRIFFDSDQHVKVASCACAIWGYFRNWWLAFAGHSDCLTVVNSCRNFYTQFTVHCISTPAVAIFTFFFYNAASTVASWASRNHSKHSAKTRLRNLALPLTSSTSFWCCAGLRSIPLASFANIKAVEFYFSFRSCKNFFKRNFNIGFKIVATHLPIFTTTSAPSST